MKRREEDYLRFDDYYREHWYRLCKIAKIRLGDDGYAEDVVADTFSTAWARRKDFFASPNPTGWLYKTLKNKIRNVAKEQARLSALLVEQDVEELGRGDALDPRLSFEGMVSPEELQLLYSCYVRGKSCQELADELEIELSACKMRVKRAREKFLSAYTSEIGR